MPESGVVRAAIVQATWSGDTASMIEIHEVQEAEHHRWAEPGPDEPTVQRMFYRDRRPDAYGSLVQP